MGWASAGLHFVSTASEKNEPSSPDCRSCAICARMQSEKPRRSMATSSQHPPRHRSRALRSCRHHLCCWQRLCVVLHCRTILTGMQQAASNRHQPGARLPHAIRHKGAFEMGNKSGTGAQCRMKMPEISLLCVDEHGIDTAGSQKHVLVRVVATSTVVAIISSDIRHRRQTERRAELRRAELRCINPDIETYISEKRN